ncbi:integration host factor, actinobacterial type [Atopobiaceae bacterium 24-176]
MKPTDTFKYQLLDKLCSAFDAAQPADEPPTVVPADILPSYLESDNEASRKQAQWMFSAVQSLESQRIVRMAKSKHDGGTFVDAVTLEDPEKAAHELEKLSARVAQEEAEQARAEEAVARKQPSAQALGAHAQRHGRRRTSGPVDPRITEEAAEYLDEVDSPLTPRELSLLVTGDTKKLDRVGLKRVAQTLRRRGSSASRSNVGALEEAGVVADLKTICVKGPVVLITQKGAVDASILPNGISMFDADLANIDRAYVRARRIVTVENLDAYRRCNDDDVYIYTQGSVSPRHRALLRMIHEQNPGVSFAHFGDIDYAGLKAHKVIEDTLGCEVELFHMGIAELANPAYRKASHPLTSKDRDLLARLLEFERYRGLVSYMLERNVKLEQEIVALDLFSDYDVDSAMAALPAGRGGQGEGQQDDGKRREGTYRKQSQRSRGQRKQQAADGQGAQQQTAQQQAPKTEPTPKAEQAAEPEVPVEAEVPADAAPAEKADAPKPRRRRRSRRPKAEQPVEGQAAELADAEHPAADADVVADAQAAVSEVAPEDEAPAAGVEADAADTQEAEQAEPEQRDVRPGRAGRRRRSSRSKAAAEKAAEQPEPAADADRAPAPEDAPEPAADQPDAEVDAPEADAPKPRRRRRSRRPKAAQPEADAAAEAVAPADAASEEAPAPETPAGSEPGPAEAKPVSKAAQTRKLRSDLLDNIKSGAVSPADVLNAVDDAARSLTVVRFLSALPGWDRARATAFMEEVGISAGRTLRGLGKKQRARVVEAVNEG